MGSNQSERVCLNKAKCALAKRLGRCVDSEEHAVDFGRGGTSLVKGIRCLGELSGSNGKEVLLEGQRSTETGRNPRSVRFHGSQVRS